MSLVSGKELESKFCETRTYGRENKWWPRSTICLFKCKVKDFYGNQKIITGSEQYGYVWDRLDNTQNKHAEIHMIEDLQEDLKHQYENIEEIAIKININYSPCIECAHKIIEWKNFINLKNITVRMHIRFANFYHCHGTNNYCLGGLMNLLQAKITLDVFDRGFWDSFLYDVLKLRKGMGISHAKRHEMKKTLDERAVRENIDKICLMCLKKKSKFSLEETDEEKSLLDQVCSNDDESGINYETYVYESGKKYVEYLQVHAVTHL